MINSWISYYGRLDGLQVKGNVVETSVEELILKITEKNHKKLLERIETILEDMEKRMNRQFIPMRRSIEYLNKWKSSKSLKEDGVEEGTQKEVVTLSSFIEEIE